MKDQELIDTYLAGLLSEDQASAFEKRLVNEPPLKDLLESTRFAVGVLKRDWLKRQMKTGGVWINRSIVAGSMIILAFFSWKMFHLQRTETARKHQAVSTQNPLPSAVPYLNNDDSTDLVNDTTTVLGKSVKPISYESVLHKNNLSKIKKESMVPIAQKEQRFNMIDSFWVPQRTDTTFIARNGVKIHLFENSLHMSRGKDTWPVLLTYQAYDKYSTWYTNKLTTQDLGGNVLISGGMCEIKAWLGDSLLQLAPEQTIEVSFPGKNDPLLESYAGTRDSQDFVYWKLNNQVTRMGNEELISERRIDSTYFKTVFTFRPHIQDDIPIRDTISGNHEINIVSKSELIQRYMTVFNQVDDEDIKYLLEKDRTLKLIYRFRNGRFKGFDFQKFAANRFERKLEKRIRKTGTSRCICEVNPFFTASTSDGNMYVELIPEERDIYLYDTIYQIDTGDNSQSRVIKELTNYNTIIVKQLGLVNADKLLVSGSRKDFIIKTEEKVLDARMYFKEVRASVKMVPIRGGVVFPNCPVNLSAACIVINQSGNGLKMAIQEVTTDHDISLENWQLYSQSEILNFLDNFGVIFLRDTTPGSEVLKDRADLKDP